MKPALGFLLLFLSLWALIDPLTPWDRQAVAWTAQVRSAEWNRPVAWLTNLGSINILGPVALLVAAGLFWQGRKIWAAAFLGTLLWYPLLWPLRLAADRPTPEYRLRAPTAGILYTAESHIERVPSPPAPAGKEAPPVSSWKERILLSLKESMGRSFPSSHAAVSGYFYGLWLLWAWIRRSVIPATGLGALLAAVGFSRVYMAVHYPTDVIAGWSLAAVALAFLSRWLIRERIDWILAHPRRRRRG